MTAPAHNNEPSCPACNELRIKLAHALFARDLSEAVDYRVLLRRHPRHDGIPVQKTVGSDTP